MANQTQVFESSEFGKIEVLMLNGLPYFPAAECAEKLGYKKPHDAVSRHCAHSVKRGVVSQTTNQHGITSNQTVEKIFIPEGDLYRLIIRSKLPAAVRFEAWLCDTVIPCLLKHGAYITDDTLRRLREDSEFTEELLQRLEDERGKNAVLLNCVNKLAPKAQYYDVILQCPGAVQVSIIAGDYGMTAISFNKLLHKLGIQYKLGKTWRLYKKYINKGLTVNRTYIIDDRIASTHMCWTERGRMWLYEALKMFGILPEAERMTLHCD